MASIAKVFLFLGSLSAALAVMLGAFGAHALRPKLEAAKLMQTYHTGVEYHFYHSLGLLIVALFLAHYPTSSTLRWGGWLLLAGIILFSGSLYVLSMSGIWWLGIITPFGGTAFIIGWLLVAIAAYKMRSV